MQTDTQTDRQTDTKTDRHTAAWLTVLVYEEANTDAHQVEPVKKILDSAFDVVQRYVLGCSCLLHLHKSMSHHLHHGQVPSLYLVQPLRETTSNAPTNIWGNWSTDRGWKENYGTNVSPSCRNWQAISPSANTCHSLTVFSFSFGWRSA